eukprot:13047426-Ditylum_brightwellii.AAC.1
MQWKHETYNQISLFTAMMSRRNQRFQTELELWDATSLAEVFYNAKLLPRHPVREGLPTLWEVESILKKYIDQQLFYTVSSKSDLQKSLYADAGETCVQYMNMLKQEIVYKLHPLSTTGVLEGAEVLFSRLKAKVDAYINLEEVPRRVTFLHGFPGAGKTYMQYALALNCISKGLCIVNTSVAARRSHQIGRFHLA